LVFVLQKGFELSSCFISLFGVHLMICLA
jgi:hypothetical protein